MEWEFKAEYEAVNDCTKHPINLNFMKPIISVKSTSPTGGESAIAVDVGTASVFFYHDAAVGTLMNTHPLHPFHILNHHVFVAIFFSVSMKFAF